MTDLDTDTLHADAVDVRMHALATQVADADHVVARVLDGDPFGEALALPDTLHRLAGELQELAAAVSDAAAA